MVNQKHVGHLVTIVAFVLIVGAPDLGVHHLLAYGSDPGWSYTEMGGFGPSLGPWVWYKLYWTAWALLLAMVARLLWVRGPFWPAAYLAAYAFIALPNAFIGTAVGSGGLGQSSRDCRAQQDGEGDPTEGNRTLHGVSRVCEERVRYRAPEL